MEELTWGDITTIGITESSMISIEFYNPMQMDGQDFSTIWLTREQAKTIARLGEILDGKPAS